MENRYKKQIAAEFEACVAGTISRLKNKETHRPFHSALLSSDALFWSRFERSFSTSFGQRVIEKISKIAALAGGAADAANQRETQVSLSEGQLASIENHIAAIRGGSLGRPPAWQQDIASVTVAGADGDKKQVRVISDLWWKKGGVDHYMSIKTVKPNIDQTAEAKRDLLKLKLNDPTCRVYFGLYYNPYGERRQDYDWSPPKGIFDFHQDEVVLIGKDYWDALGGSGFYEEVLAIANDCGKRTRKSVGKLRR